MLKRKVRSYVTKAVVLLGMMSTFLLAGCSGDQQAEGGKSDKIIITTTTGMITDIVENVGGEHVEVSGLMKAGVDPHLYKASQGDIRKLDEAEIIFYNGLHLEGKMVDIFEKMNKEKPTFAVADAIDKSLLRSGALTGGTEYDPHVWFNVKHWMKATEKVRDELMAFDPEHAVDYKSKAETYLAKLEELDRYALEQVATIPESSRVLVTAHDAFGYFGEAYGMKVMGLQGLSTASEYGSKDVTNLRDYLVENKIKAVFVESSVPKKAIEAVVQGAKEKGHELQIGGELFSDAMGEKGTGEGTYIGMVRHNIDTIVKALK